MKIKLCLCAVDVDIILCVNSSGELHQRLLCCCVQSAGGLTAGLSVMECALKECSEEAAVPDEHLKHLKPVGLVR